MTPRQQSTFAKHHRRAFLAAGVLAMGGCMSTPFFRGQTPENEEVIDSDESLFKYIGEVTSPWGLNFAKAEGVALVTQLQGTGSNPPPSPQRERLESEMLTHEVKFPDKILASPNTSLVAVRGFLPPGAQKGDRFDIEVTTRKRSDTSSLRSGYLMQTRLRPMEVLGGSIRTGDVVGLAKGPILIDASFEGNSDETAQTRGRVLGGGVCRQDRPFGISLRGARVREDEEGPSFTERAKSIRNVAAIAAAINRRFHAVDRGTQLGAADPKNDRVIFLRAPRNYKHNLNRYILVLGNIVIRETSAERIERIQELRQQLHEPATSAVAAMRLEAIGKEAESILVGGLQSPELEVRFRAAEALAYMERRDAVPHLEEGARKEPALRWHAMAALSSMDDVEAAVALTNLMSSDSAETCYGAFRALRTRSSRDPMVRGEILGDGFGYHVISTDGPPIVHVSRSRRPEIVLFGQGHSFSADFLYRDGQWMIRRTDKGSVKVSRFEPRKDVSHEICANDVDEVVRALDRLGADYHTIVGVLQKAKNSEQLSSRLAVNALPRPGRRIRRDDTLAKDESQGLSLFPTELPIPELFRDGFNSDSDEDDPDDQRASREPSEFDKVDSTDEPRKGFFGKLGGWFAG